MEIRTFQSADEVAKEAAIYIADRIRENVARKGSFTMAISGGRTPWEMIKELAKEDLHWEKVFLFQVDERVAPDAHPDRNLTQLFKAIEGTNLVLRLNIFPMRVTADNLNEACEEYADHITRLTENGKFDLIHLGLGTDGHTASLVPGDAVLAVQDKTVAITGDTYQGRHRMTLTYPLINQAAKILWVITGAEKAEMLNRLLHQDPSIPAGKIDQHHAIVLTEESASVEIN
ncbi:MAG: 6-phosphogluconolactonase [Algoriphagus sp.]|uniref:6-phosphogluconolactonase n=1 Tax=Algoriphagus sp. TaxID=1872435 RepID=UPI0027312348|nr:6-phosphogluconolactonase [Algoriphagus sp.]MDP2040714.1 6-phosphogluconolactonase [Algoriphagus sp.]MDP3471888.1 6-phosphogluconolactonase [Algoriphagus sp.]